MVTGMDCNKLCFIVRLCMKASCLYSLSFSSNHSACNVKKVCECFICVITDLAYTVVIDSYTGSLITFNYVAVGSFILLLIYC